VLGVCLMQGCILVYLMFAGIVAVVSGSAVLVHGSDLACSHSMHSDGQRTYHDHSTSTSLLRQ
jgi:hypothetical protein